MEFYPIEIMRKEIKKLENEIKRIAEQSEDERYVESCKYVNETRIIQLHSAIAFLINAKDIPIVSE